MQTALGKMGLAPGDFWSMSPREFHAAMMGFRDFHCARVSFDTENLPSTDEIEAMVDEFPDGTMAEHVVNLEARRRRLSHAGQ